MPVNPNGPGELIADLKAVYSNASYPGTSYTRLLNANDDVNEIFERAKREAPELSAILLRHRRRCEDAVTSAGRSPSTDEVKLMQTRLVAALREMVQEGEAALTTRTTTPERPAETRNLSETDSRSMQSVDSTPQYDAGLQSRLDKALQELQKSKQQLAQLQRMVSVADSERRQAVELTEALQQKLEAMQDAHAAPEDIETAQAALAANVEHLPLACREFVSALLEVVGHLQAEDIDWFLDRPGLEKLDKYVYRSSHSIGRLALDRTGTVEIEDIFRLILLQEWAHRRLEEAGLQAICPAPGDEFDVQQHSCADGDMVWVNNDPSRHNKIVAVKRIGYRHNAEVLRKADVKRYVFHRGNSPDS